MRADQAEARAAGLRREQQHEAARVEDHLREADRVDPDTRHTAESTAESPADVDADQGRHRA